MQLSASQLETLRTRPAQTRLSLFVFKPRTVMKCLVNNVSASRGDRVIPFDSVSFGNIASVEPGMTLLVGTSEGGREVGKIRIISGTTSQFIVSENSNIQWQDNQHLTVLRYWDIWPVFPRIILDPTNDENVIFYKDYDTPYTNQNFYMGTFVNAGPHRPVFLENGTGTVFYSSTGTFNLVGESALSYEWAFEGGNPTGSTSAHPGTVYYTSPGDYVTRLIVRDTINNTRDATYRYISVKNKIGEGNNTPIPRWEIDSLVGSRDEGGYSADIKIYDPDIDINEECVVMLKAEDWYGQNKTSLGGNYPQASDIFFVGYIERGSIHYNAFYGYVAFTVTSISGIMKKTTGFSVSAESKQNPATWYEIRDMDARRAIYHYLKWHSTVLSVTDFSFIGQDYPLQFFDVDRQSIFDAVDNFLKTAYLGRLSSDRQGRLWAGPDPLAYSNPTGTFLPVMEITKRDWIGEPSITENLYDGTSYLEAGGVAYSGANTGTFVAFLSGAPGRAPSYHGRVENIQGLVLQGQSHLNTLSGHLWANRNQRFPNISMEMGTPPRNLDIAPQEVVSISIEANETPRNEKISGIFIPARFRWTYRPLDGVLLAGVEFDGLVNGNPGETIPIPETSDDFEFDFPEFSFPPFPPFVLPGLPIIDPLQINNYAILVENQGVYYTNNAASSNPTWQNGNVNLQANRANLRHLEVTDSGTAFIQLGNDSVWVTPKLGQPWTKLFDKSEVGNPESFPFPTNPAVSGYGVNRKNGRVMIIGSVTVTIFSQRLFYPWYGTASGVIRVRTSNLATDIPGKGPYGSNLVPEGYLSLNTNGTWVFTVAHITGPPMSFTISEAGAAVIAWEAPISGTINGDPLTNFRSLESTQVVISRAYEQTTTIAGKRSNNNGDTYFSITGAPRPYKLAQHNQFESIITNGDGTQMVIASETYAQGLGRSLNGGLTWTTGTFGSSGTTSVWHLGSNSYLFAGARNLHLIPDLVLSTGVFIKTGNLHNLLTGSFNIMALRHY